MTRVCPFCGRPPGPGVFCESCGRNLANVEQLPTADEFVAEHQDLPAAVGEFLQAMHAAGDPGTKKLRAGKPRVFRTPHITGWIVVPVDREDFEKPKRYQAGLLLSVDGAFHQLDSELRGHGQRDFPHYEHSVSLEPVEPRADQQQRILDALISLRGPHAA
jgi:hypothetical protein